MALLDDLLIEADDADRGWLPFAGWRARRGAARRWALLERAWQTYCEGSANDFDWDYESRDLMTALTDFQAFHGRYR